MRQNIYLLTVSGFLVACASGQKDVYFRSRLPTIESIDLNEEHHWGVNLDAESSRFHIKATDNIVQNFSFRKDQVALDRDVRLQGLDASLSYSDRARIIPFQAALSSDFAELKVGIFDFRGNDKIGWKGLINFGYYKTAAFETASNGCEFICFSSRQDVDNANKSVDSIKTSQGGREEKIGASVGYYWDDRDAIFAGYNWLDGRVYAEARDDNSATRLPISFNENFYGSGFGLGYLYKFPKSATLAFTVEHIKMDWNSEPFETTLVGVRGQIGF